ncbi:MAG: YfkD family protein [Bacilli bacterium]
MKRVWYTIVFTMLCISASVTFVGLSGAEVKIPSSVVDIAKDNTYPNPTPDIPQLEPSKLAAELLQSANVGITNPVLIKMLNETSINKAPLAVGFKAKIYLGHWPLSYKSEKSTMNWSYKKVNANFYDNRTGDETYRMRYVQHTQQHIRGGLTINVENTEQVKSMIMIAAMKNTNLPLSFSTIIGENTKKENIYHISPKQLGYLSAYVPAVNEKGKVTFGEVYLHIDGGKRSIEVENVTSHGIGAWIPLQDYIHLSFMTSRKPL